MGVFYGYRIADLRTDRASGLGLIRGNEMTNQTTAKIRGSSAIEATTFARMTPAQQAAWLAYIKAAAAHAGKKA